MSQPWYSYPMTQGYNAHGHTGVDVGTPTGTPLTPLFAGTVTDAARYPWGYQVVVRSNVAGMGDIQTVYAHLDRVDVKAGQQVGTQTRIGLSGGENLPAKYSNGPHTHVGIYKASVPVWQNQFGNGQVATVDPTSIVHAAPLAFQQQTQLLSSTSGSGDCGHYIQLPSVSVPKLTQMAPGVWHIDGSEQQGGGVICFDSALDVLVRVGLVSTGVLIIVLAIIVFVRQTPAAREATGRAVAGLRAAVPGLNVAAAVAKKPEAPAPTRTRVPRQKVMQAGQ